MSSPQKEFHSSHEQCYTVLLDWILNFTTKSSFLSALKVPGFVSLDSSFKLGHFCRVGWGPGREWEESGTEWEEPGGSGRSCGREWEESGRSGGPGREGGAGREWEESGGSGWSQVGVGGWEGSGEGAREGVGGARREWEELCGSGGAWREWGRSWVAEGQEWGKEPGQGGGAGVGMGRARAEVRGQEGVGGGPGCGPRLCPHLQDVDDHALRLRPRGLHRPSSTSE